MFGFAAPHQSRLGSIAGQAQQLQAVGQQQQASGLAPGGMSALARGAGQPPLAMPAPGTQTPPPSTPQAGSPQPSAPLSAPPAAPQPYGTSAFQMPGDVNMGAHGQTAVQLDAPTYGNSGGDGGGSMWSTILSMFGA